MPESTPPSPASNTASRPDPPEDSRSGRTRLRDAMVRPTRAQVVVGLLLAALGFAAVTQVRATDVDNTYDNYREQDLVDVLNTLTVAAQRAQSEIARLETTRRDLLNSTRRDSAALAQAEQAADTLDILAGTVPVSGPGIRITIVENDGPVDVNTILDTVQELRTAGAEAMEFNDKVRVVAQTSFADGVGGIVVDGVLLESPFTLDVIGEPRTLEQSGLRFPGGPVSQLQDDGASIEVTQLNEVVIESVRDTTRLEYAEQDLGQ